MNLIWYCKKCGQAGYLGKETQLAAYAEALEAHEKGSSSCDGEVVMAELGTDDIPDWVWGMLPNQLGQP